VSTTELLTRRMRFSDLEAVARLERTTFSDPWSEAAFRHEVEGGSTSWPRVAVDGPEGEVVAYMVAWFVVDEAHLANLAVAPWARRRGLAERMLNELVDEARRRKSARILLEVRRSNRAAQALYLKNGFYTFDVRKAYYRDNQEDALVMVRPLEERGWIPPWKGKRD
jgi:ribosomal-protein-alanine N-acetyltransferase